MTTQQATVGAPSQTTAAGEKLLTRYLIFVSDDNITFKLIGEKNVTQSSHARVEWLKEHPDFEGIIVASSENAFKPFRRNAEKTVVYTNEEVPLALETEEVPAALESVVVEHYPGNS